MSSKDPAPETLALAARQAYDFSVLEDVSISIRAELDHKTVSFEKLLSLEVGSILQLGRPTGENVDIYAENALIGSGEILIVDSTLAVRVADLRNKPTRNDK